MILSCLLATASVLLGQAQQPIRIYTGEPVKPGIDWVPVAGVVGGVVVLATLCALIAVNARRRHQARVPEETALQTLARRMKLRRSDLTLVRELALAAGIQAPVAVLVSRGAFEQVLQTVVGRGAPVENVRKVRFLGQRLRWVNEKDPDPPPIEPVAKKAGAKNAAPARRVPAIAAKAAAAPKPRVTPAPSVPGRNGRAARKG